VVDARKRGGGFNGTVLVEGMGKIRKGWSGRQGQGGGGVCKSRSGSPMAWVIKSSINPSFKPYFVICVPAFSTHLRDYPGSLFGNVEVSYYSGH